MKKFKDIKINHFQLNVLLDEEQKNGFNLLLERGVYCPHCGDMCSKGIELKEIFLDSMNDIRIEGICNVCGGAVARIMEFGEDKEFFQKAIDFRKSLAK